MKGLTLWQPYASLIALPDGQGKRIETRSWPTAYRGLVAIHAALGPMNAECKEACIDNPYIFDALRKGMNIPPSIAAKQMPRGVIVAVAELHHCYRICSVENSLTSSKRMLLRDERDAEGCGGASFPGVTSLVSDKEYHFGDFTIGRFAWALRDVLILLKPISCKGGQRLWNVPADVIAQIQTACPQIKETARA